VTLPWTFWTLGAAAVAAAGVASFFYVSGMNHDSDLRKSCAPACSDSEVAGLRGRFIAGDVAALVALASAGGAVAIGLTWGPARATSTRLQLSTLGSQVAGSLTW
jgi:hypothetical protein